MITQIQNHRLSLAAALLVLIFSWGCAEPEGPAPFTFAHATDFHITLEDGGDRGTDQCIREINSLAPDFLIAGGDQLMDAYDQSMSLLKQALKIHEKTLGPEHPNTALVLNNLAALYRTMGAYDQALTLIQRALKIDAKALGPEHPTTLRTRNSLAVIYMEIGAYDQALPLLKQTLKIAKKVLGPEHPETAKILHNLGGFYFLREDWVQAENYFKQSNLGLGFEALALARG